MNRRRWLWWLLVPVALSVWVVARFGRPATGLAYAVGIGAMTAKEFGQGVADMRFVEVSLLFAIWIVTGIVVLIAYIVRRVRTSKVAKP